MTNTDAVTQAQAKSWQTITNHPLLKDVQTLPDESYLDAIMRRLNEFLPEPERFVVRGRSVVDTQDKQVCIGHDQWSDNDYNILAKHLNNGQWKKENWEYWKPLDTIWSV